MSSEFGKLLKHYRKQNNVSQAEVLNKLRAQGYSYDKSAISKWETGLHMPRAEVIEILEDILTPKSVGLLLKAAGYLYEAESRYQLAEISRQEPRHFEELSITALKIASNLSRYHRNLVTADGSPCAVGILVYGGFMYEMLTPDSGQSVELPQVDKTLAMYLLSHIKREFPELADINDWADLTNDKISEDFLQRLTNRAHRGNFKGTCPVCKGWQ